MKKARKQNEIYCMTARTEKKTPHAQVATRILNDPSKVRGTQ